nr:immunoglobulin light chain junction region [Macaca mulatta]MPO03201.1 immunoglobulin light chain junction region [Macaca mulatta]MPO03615.1 immunoglobulin light chain junction region [Macaca mulatta]MPO03767.1 immunoglobulin light chain junction region [Macaca mulatta]MPO03873.1 immunoglobulin light chain junction region [Macaca mulatta]
CAAWDHDLSGYIF